MDVKLWSSFGDSGTQGSGRALLFDDDDADEPKELSTLTGILTSFFPVLPITIVLTVTGFSRFILKSFLSYMHEFNMPPCFE